MTLDIDLPPRRFGPMLRRLRTAQQIAREALAVELALSHQYLADIEAGRKPPLGPARIRRIAAFLGADPLPLLEAAAIERGGFELEATPERMRIGALLSARWLALTGPQLIALERVLGTA